MAKTKRGQLFKKIFLFPWHPLCGCDTLWLNFSTSAIPFQYTHYSFNFHYTTSIIALHFAFPLHYIHYSFYSMLHPSQSTFPSHYFYYTFHFHYPPSIGVSVSVTLLPLHFSFPLPYFHYNFCYATICCLKKMYNIQQYKTRALRELRPPWPRQLITPILPGFPICRVRIVISDLQNISPIVPWIIAEISWNFHKNLLIICWVISDWTVSMVIQIAIKSNHLFLLPP